MPRSRFDELVALAEDNDGLITAEQAEKLTLDRTRSTSIPSRTAVLVNIVPIWKGIGYQAKKSFKAFS